MHIIAGVIWLSNDSDAPAIATRELDLVNK